VSLSDEQATICNRMHGLKIFLLFFLLSHQICSQDKFSVKFSTANARSGNQLQLFSISVKNSESFLRKYSGGVIITHHHAASGSFYIKASMAWVVNIFQHDDNVVFVDIPGTPKSESVNESGNQAFNNITTVHQLFPELKGAGRKISIKEKGFNPNDIDLINRSFTTPLTPTEISQHATAMATFIAGGGNSSETGRGAAMSATITSSDFSNLLPDDDDVFTGNQIFLQNHSYGLAIENYYGNEAAAYDKQVYDMPDLLHVLSAGNLGIENSPSGKYQGLNYANLSGNFKQAKNILLVTAVDETFSVNQNNSKGPAFDGRLKPELTAYGAGGTSDAAALVTGISALIQEAFQKKYGVPAPASAVKAILIASADDIGSVGIDYRHGYGNVNAYKALRLVNELMVDVNELTSGEEIKLPITVAPGMSELKVAVAWTDPPAMPNAEAVLVHNLDSYISHDGELYLPWRLKTAAHPDSLAAQPFRGVDNINNIEYMTIKDPAPGIYEVVVRAPVLTTTSQKVSVAYWLNEKGFSWQYPRSADVVEGGSVKAFFWETDLTGTAALWYKPDGGTWTLLSAGIDLQSHFTWDVPDKLSKAQLKMVIDGTEYLSDVFLISPRPTVTVPFNCQHDFALSWKAIVGADDYEVFVLSDQYLTSYLQTHDTMIVISKNVPHQYFSVSPRLAGQTGLKSMTIDYAAQGSGCFINLFTAQRYDVEKNLLQLRLSTLLKIKKVNIYKLSGEAKQIVHQLTPEHTLIELFDDELVSSGPMTYQAEVVLTDGTTILSELVVVDIQKRNTAVIFPNPFTSGIDVTVLSDGTGQVFRILDHTGKAVHEKKLNFMEQSLTLDELAPGMYFFQLIDQNRTLDTGKIIKL
jgi:hypothetical protein